MDYSKYRKYFDREIRTYLKEAISDEMVREALDEVRTDIDSMIRNKKRNQLAICLGYSIGIHLDRNAKNKILHGETESWKLLDKQIFWLDQMIKSVPDHQEVHDWVIGGLIGLSLLWSHDDIADLAYRYASNMFSKRADYYAENKTHHVFMTCLYHKWKTGEMPELFDILPSNHVYQRLMKHWRDSEVIGELLLEVCDFHIYSLSDTPSKSKEILLFRCIPYDFFTIKMVREKEGLSTPIIEHPLLQTKLAEIPKDKPGYNPDEDEILQYVRQNEKVPDWQRVIR